MAFNAHHSNYLPCDCKCCMFVIEKSFRENCDIDYNISVQDSRYDHNYNTVWGRLKRAVMLLFGKPIYYNDLYIEDEESFKKFVADINDLANTTLQKDEP